MVSEEIAWANMVLIPKGKEEYRSIELVEVLCKVSSLVGNCRLKRSVVLHGMLHWVQKRDRDVDGNARTQAGSAAGGACARAYLPGLTRRLKGL